MKLWLCYLVALSGFLVLASDGFGYEINDKLYMGGLLAGAYQYQSISDAPGYENEGRGAVLFQPEIGFSPTKSDAFFAKFGFAAGNSLNDVTPFVLVPWAANLQDDVKDINGRNRDYLLTAWYKHTFTFSAGHTLGLTGGIIDATDYMNENAYADDENTQFMNEALTNGPGVFLPSYDFGVALEWAINDFSVRGAAMAVGDNGETEPNNEPYNFFGIQLGYKVNTVLGVGNYRVNMDITSDSFPDPKGQKKERLYAALISFDQQLGEVIGVWIRFEWQDDDTAVNFTNVYTGGININGNLWDRACDNIGIGYGHLRGGNLDFDHTDVFEIYGRFAVNEIFAVTGDVQYMKDSMKTGSSPKGWIFGLRLSAEF
jgi:porin